MNLQQTMSAIAGRELSDDDAMKFCRDQWGIVVSWLYEHHGEITGAFPVTSVHRDDFAQQGYDASKVTDDEMRYTVARRLADAFCDSDVFWCTLDYLAEHTLELPKLKK